MHDTRNKKPDLKEKILGMILHIENIKKNAATIVSTNNKIQKSSEVQNEQK